MEEKLEPQRTQRFTEGHNVGVTLNQSLPKFGNHSLR
jgi:hypothetical protein